MGKRHKGEFNSFHAKSLESSAADNIRIPKSKKSKRKLVKIELLIIIIIIFFMYGGIYSFLGANHLNNYISFVDGFYFSMTTISTTGYGDITPKTTLAKIIVMSQQFLTLLILSILLLE